MSQLCYARSIIPPESRCFKSHVQVFMGPPQNCYNLGLSCSKYGSTKSHWQEIIDHYQRVCDQNKKNLKLNFDQALFNQRRQHQEDVAKQVAAAVFRTEKCYQAMQKNQERELTEAALEQVLQRGPKEKKDKGTSKRLGETKKDKGTSKILSETMPPPSFIPPKKKKKS